MRSFRSLALLLAFTSPAALAVLAQASSSNPQTPQSSSSQTQQQSQQTPSLTQQEMTVQERIRLRRQQRRAQAIHDTYSHLYEAYSGAGYLRFTPGPSLQKVTLYAWDEGFTRYYNLKLGVTLDGRGYYGTAFVGINPTNLTRPAISQYDILIGPTYRFMLRPKYSLSGRLMGGYAQGNFSGDTSGFGTAVLGLYPDGSTYAVSASLFAEYNLTPTVGLRLGANDFVTGFGSTQQNSVGFTGGFLYRFGKQ